MELTLTEEQDNAQKLEKQIKSSELRQSKNICL